ncbi:thiamine-phosphate kinase [Microbulbifer yueqingensis]|uniref:Thiamine-monophosphate kinase n=1 Tax=Microbulbifer yueqingensis TaxID=658219 RepID=A0A1G8XYB8_9GAMM|nr:thiamine-phosphate kinase [Microbulbifer yueqingensis]SDJ95569.1 thiamine-phosphate kinase [Microbulbifer yueqingensis]
MKQAAPGEFEIIRDYFADAPRGEGVVLGIGDDCALLEPPVGRQLATTVDTLVAGRHFPADADPALVAGRALRVNLSDLAAMNARPLWFTLALTLPESDREWLQGFADGLLQTAREYGISLVGGDTTKGPLTITIQVTGSVATPLRRDGAGPGDAVFVSGPLGAAAAALPVILGERPAAPALEAQAVNAYYHPEPQLALAEAIAGLASAALDISDGLLADLGHICARSGVDAELDMAKIPVASLARELAGPEALELAATGGDDYQLCFTVPEGKVEEAIDHCRQRGLTPVRIGTLVERGTGPAAGGRVRCHLEGEEWRARRPGYTHF